MILALETGWTPDVLGEISLRFKRSCHWALYGRAIAGTEGLNVPSPSTGGSPEQKLALARASVQADRLRKVLYPEDDDG